MTNTNKILISFLLIMFAITCRLLPHAWNFTPVIAISLFAGVYLDRKYAIALPLLIIFLSDYFLGYYAWPLMVAVYSSYILVGILSVVVRKNKSVEMIVAVSIISSSLFFLVTNFAVWQLSTVYTNNLTGLIECYTLGLPFFRNSLLGCLFYTAFLFGLYESIAFFAVKHKFVSNFNLRNL